MRTNFFGQIDHLPGDSLVVHKNGFDSELSNVFGLPFWWSRLFSGVASKVSPDGGLVPLLLDELQKRNKINCFLELAKSCLISVFSLLFKSPKKGAKSRSTYINRRCWGPWFILAIFVSEIWAKVKAFWD